MASEPKRRKTNAFSFGPPPPPPPKATDSGSEPRPSYNTGGFGQRGRGRGGRGEPFVRGSQQTAGRGSHKRYRDWDNANGNSSKVQTRFLPENAPTRNPSRSRDSHDIHANLAAGATAPEVPRFGGDIGIPQPVPAKQTSRYPPTRGSTRGGMPGESRPGGSRHLGLSGRPRPAIGARDPYDPDEYNSDGSDPDEDEEAAYAANEAGRSAIQHNGKTYQMTKAEYLKERIANYPTRAKIARTRILQAEVKKMMRQLHRDLSSRAGEASFKEGKDYPKASRTHHDRRRRGKPTRRATENRVRASFGGDLPNDSEISDLQFLPDVSSEHSSTEADSDAAPTEKPTGQPPMPLPPVARDESVPAPVQNHAVHETRRNVSQHTTGALRPIGVALRGTVPLSERLGKLAHDEEMLDLASTISARRYDYRPSVDGEDSLGSGEMELSDGGSLDGSMF